MKAATALLRHPSDAYVNERVRQELALMLARGTKMETEAISADSSFFVGEYLPRKLFDTDFGEAMNIESSDEHLALALISEW